MLTDLANKIGAIIASLFTTKPAGENVWKLKDAGLDKSIYKIGDKATAFIIIENAQGGPIKTLTANVSVARKIGDDYPFSFTESRTLNGLNILPGTEDRIEYGAVVPASMMGLDLVGEYRVILFVRSGEVYLGGKTLYVAITQ
jgi:hypothetical protein